MIGPSDILNLTGLANLLPKGWSQKLLGLAGLASKVKPSEEDGTTKAAEGGKGHNDEHHYLIGLASGHFGGKTLAELQADGRAELTAPKRKKLAALFAYLREQGREGGAEKLMQIIGHEAHLVTKAKKKPPQQKKGQGGNAQPAPVAPEDEYELVGMRERINPSGHLILLFLTDIRTVEAAELLIGASVVDTPRDKRAAATKAAGEAANQTWNKVKAWYAGHDTEVHLWLANLAVGKQAVMAAVEAPRGQAHRQAIEAIEARLKHATKTDKPTIQKELEEAQERFQQYLIFVVKAEQEIKPPAAANHKFNWFGWVCGGIIVVAVTLAVVMQPK